MEYGRWELAVASQKVTQLFVLILVVMEYGRWEDVIGAFKTWKDEVLILVVMEYGRWDILNEGVNLTNCRSLNPCCNGIWSVGSPAVFKKYRKELVLILVVMEYGRWEATGTYSCNS